MPDQSEFSNKKGQYTFSEPTFAGKPVYDGDIYSDIGEMYGGLGTLILLASFIQNSTPRELLADIKSVIRNPNKLIELWREDSTPKELGSQAYGHQDVIDFFRGRMSYELVPNTTPRKKLIICLGGGQGGNIGAGYLQGMQSSGAYDRADSIVGVSAGICNVIYTETDQNAEGVLIYQDDNTQEGFFVKLPKDKRKAARSLAQLLKKGPESPILDTQTVSEGMRMRHPLDIEKLMESNKELFVVLMDAETGNPKYVDLKSTKDVFKLVDAAVCIPAVSSVSSVELEDGRRYVDGGAADYIPLKWAFANGYTDVVILANSPIVRNNGLLAKTFQSLVTERLARNPRYSYSPAVVENLKNYHRHVNRSAEFVNTVIKENHPDRRVVVVEPYDNAMSGLLETNRDILQAAYKSASGYTGYLFSPYT